MTVIGLRAAYGFATLVIVGLGLFSRWSALGLPWPVAKYLGSALWGAMVYTGLRLIAPRVSISVGATTACAVAVGVEIFRLYHWPWLDAFRLTAAGKLLIGSVFSPWNIVAYASGILVAALIDHHAGPRRGQG